MFKKVMKSAVVFVYFEDNQIVYQKSVCKQIYSKPILTHKYIFKIKIGPQNVYLLT